MNAIPEEDERWAGNGFDKCTTTIHVSENEEAARKFLRSIGLNPTPDAVEQLAEVFVPALKIMCDRGYNPNGETWRKGGWRGQLLEIRKKCDRLWERSWLHGAFDYDSARDLVNYAGFYLRLGGKGEPWGELGAPGDE